MLVVYINVAFTNRTDNNDIVTHYKIRIRREIGIRIIANCKAKIVTKKFNVSVEDLGITAEMTPEMERKS